MALDKAFLEGIPTILDFDVESLESGDNVMITNFSYSEVNKQVNIAAAEGLSITEAFNPEDLRPTDSGLTNKEFLEKMQSFTQERDLKIMIADGDTMIIKADQGTIDQLESKFGKSGDKFDFNLGNDAGLKKFIEHEVRIVSKGMELKGLPYEHILLGTVPHPSLEV